MINIFKSKVNSDTKKHIKNIASALYGNHLCLFLGTGFSAFLTKRKDLGWLDVLENSLDILGENEKVIQDLKKVISNAKLKPHENKITLSPELIAEMIICYCPEGKPDLLKEKIKTMLSPLKADNENAKIFNDFISASSSHRLEILTTNYDRLVENICGDNCTSFSYDGNIESDPTHPIVYHIHGNINDLDKLVLTKEDYLDWSSDSNYFKNKAYTIFNERVVLFCGYSLGDNNILSFLKKYRQFYNKHDHYFFSRTIIADTIKNHFYQNYRLVIIDDFDDLGGFLSETTVTLNTFKQAQSKLPPLSSEDYYSVISKKITCSDDSLKSDMEQKIELTKVANAWEQYTHLASWLCKILSDAELSALSDKNRQTILSSALYSFENMSKDIILGYSWASYKVWSYYSDRIIESNKKELQDFFNQASVTNAIKNFREIFNIKN